MAHTQNLYAAYKKDTKYLVYWLIHVTNRLIKNAAEEAGEAPKGLNTTGQTTINNLLSMAEIIAKHAEPVPSAIYRLLQSTIEARTTVYGAFQLLSSSKNDPDVQRSNAGHKHFIDILTQAFNILGGENWNSSNDAASTNNDQKDGDMENILAVANKFSTLHVEDNEAGSSGDEEDDGFQVQEQVQAARRGVKKSSGKGRKGKKTKKGKSAKKNKKDKSEAGPAEVNIDDIPLESFKIIDSEDGLVSEYLLAVYSAVKEWADLRAYVQALWKNVAYDGLNSAVAGAVSKMAIAMVERTTSMIFVDFPGHDSYHTIMNTITRGDPDKAQGNFHLELHTIGPASMPEHKVVDTDIDVKEQFLIHTYNDLVDFATDFQKTRSGKPTKAMLARLANWSPTFDLQSATEEQRRDWRRCYTIMWLYDLVNVFSSIVVQRNTLKGEKHAYEHVDWSPSGPWDQHRRLFGLVEFAGEITKFAMQKPGTNIQKMILPQHVFQLQCIVDSFVVSRGWSIHGLYGHVLKAPAPGFRPRRDVDLFLDRENKRMGHGFLQGVEIVTQIWNKSIQELGERDLYVSTFEVLKIVQEDFIDWLGETKYMHGLNTIPPSRFSRHNTNGLYEYSPFLCGTGLLEGLDLAYGWSMIFWDRMQEPLLIIHIHNMLVQKGYITEPVGLYQTLQDLFKGSFFANGIPPTSNFSNALLNKLQTISSRSSQRERKAISQRAATATGGIYEVLDLESNQFFRTKSNITLYRTANWNPDAIPNKDLELGTLLFHMRLAQAETIVDPKTNQRRFKDSTIIRRAQEVGMSEEFIHESRKDFQKVIEKETISPSVLNALTPSGYSTEPNLPSLGSRDSSSELTGTALLDVLKLDVLNDVCGTRPLSSLNYIQATSMILILFLQIEERLKEIRDPLWVEAYEKPRPQGFTKRFAFTMLLLDREDDDCMKVVADAFQNMRAGFMNHIYWEDLVTSSEDFFPKNEDEKPGSNQCSIM